VFLSVVALLDGSTQVSHPETGGTFGFYGAIATQLIPTSACQEEFAEALPDGYRFELVNGSTKVTPFQR
jgi:hypothetical protein